MCHLLDSPEHEEQGDGREDIEPVPANELRDVPHSEVLEGEIYGKTGDDKPIKHLDGIGVRHEHSGDEHLAEQQEREENQKVGDYRVNHNLNLMYPAPHSAVYGKEVFKLAAQISVVVNPGQSADSVGDKPRREFSILCPPYPGERFDTIALPAPFVI